MDAKYTTAAVVVIVVTAMVCITAMEIAKTLDQDPAEEYPISITDPVDSKPIEGSAGYDVCEGAECGWGSQIILECDADGRNCETVETTYNNGCIIGESGGNGHCTPSQIENHEG